MGFWSNFLLIILYWEAFLWNHPPFWEMRISWTVFHHNLKDYNSFLLLSLLINVNLHFNQVSSCWWRLGYADCSFFYSCSILFQIFFLFVIRLWGMLWSLLLLLLFFFSGWTATPWMVRYCGISCFACHVGCLAIHVRPNYAIITGPLLPKFRFAHVCIILISLSDCSFNWFKTFFPRTLLPCSKAKGILFGLFCNWKLIAQCMLSPQMPILLPSIVTWLNCITCPFHAWP